jgi:hypothetical protein
LVLPDRVLLAGAVLLAGTLLADVCRLDELVRRGDLRCVV